MAKTKEQKRKEALERQRKHLIEVMIPRCIQLHTHGDEEDKLLARKCLVSSAYAAHCDIHGNYLDHRYYKEYWKHSNGIPKLTWNSFEYAMQYTLLPLDDMKNLFGDSTDTLYRLAYWMP